MLQPKPRSQNYDELFTGIDAGRIKIPNFQRNFVWGKTQTAALIDSIVKGYPIGTFILWKTREELRHYRNIGNHQLPSPPRGDAVHYVLDGQQRITSLYAVRKGLVITREGEEVDYKDISINLGLDPDTDEEIVTILPVSNGNTITVYELLNGQLAELARKYPNDLERIDVYRKRLTGYEFSTIEISTYPLEVACEIFTRINTAGTELSLFEIMVAKTYNERKRFDFAEEYEKLMESGTGDKDLEDAGYDTIPSSTILQCVSAVLCKQIRRKDILSLNKGKFIGRWPEVKDGIFKAVDYLRSHLRVPVSRLLPYNTLLVPFTYFFLKNGGDNPSSVQNRYLSEYFWWASLTNRFTSGAEGKIAADIKRMDRILKGKAPNYKGEEYEPAIEDLQWRWFSTSESFCKAVLCLYAHFQPKSFESGSVVMLDNSWLKRADSKNYHHFFPKAYLRNNGWDASDANSVMNITLVSDSLNKRKIGAQEPSKYMRKFQTSNDTFNDTIKSHLIDDLDTYGILDDDYKRFIKKRSQRVLRELKKRLPQKR